MTKYQRDVQRTADELAAEFRKDGKPEPTFRAALKAQMIRDDFRKDGIRAAVAFYGKVADTLYAMAKSTETPMTMDQWREYWRHSSPAE